VTVHYSTDLQAARETLVSLKDGAHATFAADVADAGSTRGLVEGVTREMGGIDVLVNNAAVFEPHPVSEVDFGARKTRGPGRSRRTSSGRLTCAFWPPES
jgi:3-oxoacyl-[acyl-carrier protein] reductase